MVDNERLERAKQILIEELDKASTKAIKKKLETIIIKIEVLQHQVS